MLRTLSELTVIAAASLIARAAMTRGQGGLASLLPRDFAGDLRDVDPDAAAMMQQMPQQLGFLMFAAEASAGVLLLYGLAVLANTLLKRRHLALRPSLALEVRGLPGWLLVLLALSAILAGAGEGDDRFTGEALFVLFLLPYLLCGVAWVHSYSLTHPIPLRRVWITCFYVALIFGRWPALPVIGIGLYTQLCEILDRRKKMG